jgi:YD repeat-containing protein
MSSLHVTVGPGPLIGATKGADSQASVTSETTQVGVTSVDETSVVIRNAGLTGPPGPAGPPGSGQPVSADLTYLDGRLVAVTTPATVRTLSYDLQGRLSTVDDTASGTTSTLVYSPDGSLDQVIVN